MTIQVFISYKSEYRDFAREVKQRIQTWGYKSWLDVDEIPDGSYFRFEIDKGLKHSDAVVGIITREAQESREVLFELDFAIKKNKLLVPLKYSDCELLYHLESIQWIDFTKDPEEGFERLHRRLSALAIKAPPDNNPTPSVESEPIAGQDLKPGTVTIDNVITEQEKKDAVLDDFIGGGLALKEALTSSPPPPPKPITQQQPESGTAPASPIAQPQRQAEYNIPMQEVILGGKKGRSLLWPLAAVASLLIVVGSGMILNSRASVSATTQESQGNTLFVLGGFVTLLGIVVYFGRPQYSSSTSAGLEASSTEDIQNRAMMLQKVEEYWLRGVLDPALEAGTLDIGLSPAPGAVLRHKDYGDYELPPNANVFDIFNDLNRELLILGVPGGGKTVLLLQLARALIAQVKTHSLVSPIRNQQVEAPIPVVFNLSSWEAEHKPLADWIVDELREKYQVLKKVAATWIESEKLLLLLDGLDEISEHYRNDCVDAINDFRKQYRTVDLAVCSRIADYDALTSKLDVRGAIFLEPLSQPIIDAYLNRPDLISLQQILGHDKDLQDMSNVPFLLNAMVYAYAGATLTNLQFPLSADPAKARRTHLFDRWLEKRLAANPSKLYTPKKVRRWLRWLGEKMNKFENVRFYIEDLQPSNLTSRTMLRVYHIMVGFALFVFLLVVFSIAGALAHSLIGGITIGLVIGGTAGAVIGVEEILDTGVNISERKIPNQGIYLTGRNALMVSLGSASIFIIVSLLAGLEVLGAIGFGFAGGVTIGLAFGGGSILVQHLILRLLILQLRDAPWDYARFLDYCVSAGIMRKVGGGYIFAHRYLLEYFAEIGEENKQR